MLILSITSIIAAIAGGVAEAMFGIPDSLAGEGLSRLPTDMNQVIRKLYGKAGKALL